MQDYLEVGDILFEFGFERMDTKIKTPRDEKIKYTLLHILISFFKSMPSAAIYYVCDSSDKSHIGRKKLFDRWFFECEDTDNSLFVKYDFEPEAEDMDLFISFIAIKTNPDLPQILLSFEKIIQDYYIEK